MKKQFVLIAAAVAALFAISCVKENPVENAPVQGAMKEVTITATIDEATKTSYDAEGVFSWTKGDKISIKGSDNVFYTFTASESAASSTFTGMIPEGVSLQKHALYPANELNAQNSDGSYAFCLPEYKDLTGCSSAEIPMSSYVSSGVYNFKHMTGAALLTFTNIPDEFVSVEISVKADQVRLSGLLQLWSGSPFSWSAATAKDESEKTFTRKVSVKDNQAELYLPYKGEFWDNCTINIIGFDADGNTGVLLKDKKMKGSSSNVYAAAMVIPYAPLELPAYVPPVNWEGLDWSSDDVVSPEKVGGLNYGKVLVDANYIYVNLQAPSTMAWDKIYCYFGWGEGTVDLGGFGWTTALLDSFRYKGVYAEGVISMPDAETKVVPADDNVNYYFAFKRNASATLSAAGEVYLGFHIYNGGEVPATFPKTWQGDNCALKITLP